MATAAVRSGRWSILAHSDELLRRCAVPALWIGGSLYWKDEVVGRVSGDDDAVPRISSELLHAHTPYTFYMPGAFESVVATRLCPDEAVSERLRELEKLGAALHLPRNVTYRLYFKNKADCVAAKEHLNAGLFAIEERYGPASFGFVWQLRVTAFAVAQVDQNQSPRGD